MQKFRALIQIIFLVIFLALMIMGKAQFWMMFIFFSIIISAFWGRFYCGWACPINTLIRPVNWLKKTLKINGFPIPLLFKTGKPRFFIFGLFLIGLFYTIYTITQGRKFPLPLIIIPLGLLTTLFFSENAWHRYLCPWGVLFGLTGKYARKGLKSEGCISCTLCQKVCPGEAITVDRASTAAVDPEYCLLCLQCKTSCPSQAILYK